MRERPEVVGESSAGEEVKRKRIDLSVPQVAGSAVAAVVAAKLASYFGVYGTILGAGLVSVVATCGGSLFQHFFSRTGEQLRDTQLRDAQVRDTQLRDAKVRAPRVAAKPTVRAQPAPGEFTEGTVHRARSGRRRRPVVAAALVFGVAMAGITTYELVSGDSFSGDQGTTVTGAVSGGGSSSGTSPGSSDEDADPTPSPSSSSPSSPSTGEAPSSGGTSSPDGGSDSGEGAGDDSAGGATAGTAPTSTAPEGGTGAGDSATPEPTESATPPEPSASSRSGTDGQDPAGPAAP
ncbi:hypothetical protein [Streptomyces sp. Root1310]|uniref:hypothetical protein n=1 Tax=Streptomyces sp. Root1310 TaxID=1736452 RepID=UPI00070B5F04|nr:hypothetical protein [Streptomyces sp. Root1310]KQX63112.1 hypothetical protein ASD48_24295 [Streptomyces sp. Root1310]